MINPNNAMRAEDNIMHDASGVPFTAKITKQRARRTEEKDKIILPFQISLHDLLQHAETNGKDDIVSFSSNGKTFAIHKVKAFAEEILPKYFRTKRFTSFQRQLLLYGFKRITVAGSDVPCYYHTLFVKGQRSLSLNITRKSQGIPCYRVVTDAKDTSICDPMLATQGSPPVRAGKPQRNYHQYLDEHLSHATVSAAAREDNLLFTTRQSTKEYPKDMQTNVRRSISPNCMKNLMTCSQPSVATMGLNFLLQPSSPFDIQPDAPAFGHRIPAMFPPAMSNQRTVPLLVQSLIGMASNSYRYPTYPAMVNEEIHSAATSLPPAVLPILLHENLLLESRKRQLEQPVALQHQNFQQFLSSTTSMVPPQQQTNDGGNSSSSEILPNFSPSEDRIFLQEQQEQRLTEIESLKSKMKETERLLFSQHTAPTLVLIEDRPTKHQRKSSECFLSDYE